MKRYAGILLLAAFALVSGCASVPMASNEMDTQAKQFQPPPGKANIYVFRNESIGAGVRMEVDLDGRQVGVTAAKTYLVLPVNPGEHTLVSHAENDSKVTLTAEAGKNYFLWQEVKMGFLYARTKLQQVDEQTGRNGVLECRLIKMTP